MLEDKDIEIGYLYHFGNGRCIQIENICIMLMGLMRYRAIIYKEYSDPFGTLFVMERNEFAGKAEKVG